MRADYWLFALLGIANATALMHRQDDGYDVDAPSYEDYDGDDYDTTSSSDAYAAQPYSTKVYSSKSYPAMDSYPTQNAYPAKPYSTKGYPSEDSDAYPTAPPPPPSSNNYHQGPPSSDSHQDPPSGDSHQGPPLRDSYPEPASTKSYSNDNDYDDSDDYYKKPAASSTPWHPKTEHPEFFSLRVDEKCDTGETANQCQFDNYAIRLEKGIVIATPYNKWWDPKLPIMFVDDDTELYTVSKQPLQLYVDTVTGALRYAPVGWLPPDSIAFSFYKTGNNPLGKVDPSPAHLSWPSTQGNTLYGDGPWSLCPLGSTGQYQVFVSNENYGGRLAAGVYKDSSECKKKSLAAINANPWSKGQQQPW